MDARYYRPRHCFGGRARWRIRFVASPQRLVSPFFSIARSHATLVAREVAQRDVSQRVVGRALSDLPPSELGERGWTNRNSRLHSGTLWSHRAPFHHRVSGGPCTTRLRPERGTPGGKRREDLKAIRSRSISSVPLEVSPSRARTEALVSEGSFAGRLKGGAETN